MKILVAGVGNLLQGDDGFGVEVAHRLQARKLPPEVTVCETGMGGIHLVQEISAGYDVLIVVDAVDRERPPGQNPSPFLPSHPTNSTVHDAPSIGR